jgi:hypothetical protein
MLFLSKYGKDCYFKDFLVCQLLHFLFVLQISKPSVVQIVCQQVTQTKRRLMMKKLMIKQTVLMTLQSVVLITMQIMLAAIQSICVKIEGGGGSM